MTWELRITRNPDDADAETIVLIHADPDWHTMESSGTAALPARLDGIRYLASVIRTAETPPEG